MIYIFIYIYIITFIKERKKTYSSRRKKNKVLMLN